MDELLYVFMDGLSITIMTALGNLRDVCFLIISQLVHKLIHSVKLFLCTLWLA